MSRAPAVSMNLVNNLVWADERAAIVPGLCTQLTDAPT